MAVDDRVPEIRFAQARGGRIAWQQWGSGDEDVVAIPPAAQNVEVAWERDEIRTMFDRFGSFSRFLHYDKRGTGASDRGDSVPGLDTRVDDLRAVMDDAGVERAHLFAQSEGGPTTLLFAATYPHRVKSLIMLGTGACVVSAEDAADPDTRRAHLDARRAYSDVWGTDDSMSIGLFGPSKLDDDDFRRWFARYERASATADGVYDLMVQMIDMDVREIVGAIDAPMIVMHRRDEVAMPIRLGRELASLARDATFIELEGTDHWGFLGDVDSWMNEMERWVTGTVRDRPRVADPGRASITTMGRFAVTVDGHEVVASAWGSRRARVLLKRLIVAEGWPVTREELFDLLWPDETDRARLGARLSVQLSAVRKVLGGGVVADRQTVALDLDHVEVDVFDVLAAAKTRHDATVVERYGEFLPEEQYDDWASGMRERVRTAFTSAAHRMLTEAADRDDHQSMIDLAERVLAADPADELAHASLIDALTSSGDQAAAQRARSRRDEQLG